MYPATPWVRSPSVLPTRWPQDLLGGGYQARSVLRLRVTDPGLPRLTNRSWGHLVGNTEGPQLYEPRVSQGTTVSAPSNLVISIAGQRCRDKKSSTATRLATPLQYCRNLTLPSWHCGTFTSPSQCCHNSTSPSLHCGTFATCSGVVRSQHCLCAIAEHTHHRRGIVRH